MQNVYKAITIIKEELGKCPVENPEFEAQYIVAGILSIPRLELYIHRERALSGEEVDRLLSALSRRMTGKPLQYILGKTSFMELDYIVNPAVLIPRVETELLVRQIIDDFSSSPKSRKLLDIGTGSGIIAISLSHRFPLWQVDACDSSLSALAVAKQNAAKNKVEVNYFHSDLFEKATAGYDIIVSNPPYIGEEEYRTLPCEIIDYEPKAALLAGEEGLFFYRRILEQAGRYLNKDGVIYLEIGSKQADDVKKLALSAGFQNIDVKKDYNHFDRIVIITENIDGQTVDYGREKVKRGGSYSRS